MPAGRNEVRWNALDDGGRQVASGVELYVAAASAEIDPRQPARMPSMPVLAVDSGNVARVRVPCGLFRFIDVQFQEDL